MTGQVAAMQLRTKSESDVAVIPIPNTAAHNAYGVWPVPPANDSVRTFGVSKFVRAPSTELTY